MLLLLRMTLITALGCLVGCQGIGRAAEPVDSVRDVTTEWQFNRTPMLVIRAKRMVNTGGWSHAKLQPRKGEQWVFDLVAIPPAPGTAVTMGFEVVEASYFRNYLSTDPKTVTVHAAGNSLSKEVPPYR